jgi:hypothetical protein
MQTDKIVVEEDRREKEGKSLVFLGLLIGVIVFVFVCWYFQIIGE